MAAVRLRIAAHTARSCVGGTKLRCSLTLNWFSAEVLTTVKLAVLLGIPPPVSVVNSADRRESHWLASASDGTKLEFLANQSSMSVRLDSSAVTVTLTLYVPLGAC